MGTLAVHGGSGPIERARSDRTFRLFLFEWAQTWSRAGDSGSKRCVVNAIWGIRSAQRGVSGVDGSGRRPLEYFTRLFLEYTVLLEPFFLSSPARRTWGRRIREACGHFRRPLENEIATQRILQDGKRNARYLLRCQRPPSQIWSEAKRFVRLLELKNTSRPLFDWNFQIIIFSIEKDSQKMLR